MDEERMESTTSIIIPEEPAEERTAVTYEIKESETEGKAIAALVLGISSIVLLPMTYFLAIPAGILGIVFGKIGMSKTADGTKKGRGMALAGFICSIIGVGLVVFILLMMVSVLDSTIGWPSRIAGNGLDRYL